MALRVRDIAAELGVSPSALQRELVRLGFPARSVSSKVDEFAAALLRYEFAVEPTPPPLKSVSHAGPVRYFPTSRANMEAKRYGRRGVNFAGTSLANEVARGTTGTFGRRSSNSPTSTVRAVTAAERVEMGLDVPSIGLGLEGSPYSVSNDQATDLSQIYLPKMTALSVRARRALAVARERTTQATRIAKSTEIYESNRLEGLGPDLETTDRLLGENSLLSEVDISLAELAIERCLQSDQRVRDVVGLGAARLLAESFCADPRRPISEIDLRQLHGLILTGDSRGGRYKLYLNRITGSTHQPHAPTDTPGEMAALIAWMRETTLSPLWQAAVAHAWLTHVHPFDDGNGRIARLLANLILIRNGFPALIVRADADRGEYIDALAGSDVGGDILPLVDVFQKVLSRSVHDLENPAFSQEMYELDTKQSNLPTHIQWSRLLEAFLGELAPRLLLRKLDLFYVGNVGESQFARIESGYPLNTWVAKVGRPGASRDLLLHVAGASTQTLQHLGRNAGTPSVFVSFRSPRPLDAHTYLPIGDMGFAYEFTPIPEDNKLLIRRRGAMTLLTPSDAAELASDYLARSHRQLIGSY